MERQSQLGMGALENLPISIKALFTCFLITIGCGYLAAVYYLFTIDIDPHLKMGMSVVQGIQMKYHGQRTSTKLEGALRGVMSDRTSATDRETIIRWIHAGATSNGFPEVKPIFDNSCSSCHSSKSGLAIVPLTTFEEVKKVAEVDTGPSLSALARVSHIHLFGISLLFILTGGIFSLSRLSQGWKLLFIVSPYVSIWLDIGSWWITKYEPMFAYIVLIGGGLMGISLAAQILISLWEMWILPSRISIGPRSD
jgi:hypothetical protein